MAYKYKARRIRRSKQPTDRSVRAGGFLVSTSQIVAYTYTATDPCKVCNLSLEIGLDDNTDANSEKVYYAVVYVPEGYNVNTMQVTDVTQDLYNPTKNIMVVGVLTNDGGGAKKTFSRVSRKMAVGDRIALIINRVNNGSTQDNTGNFVLQFTTVH